MKTSFWARRVSVISAFSSNGERTRGEQVSRFMLLPLGLHILKTATTLQTYRKQAAAIRTTGNRRGSNRRRMIQWWGFVALFPTEHIKVQVIVWWLY